VSQRHFAIPRPVRRARRPTKRGRPSPLETILQDWPGALARVSTYLRAIGFAPSDVGRLAKRAVERALGARAARRRGDRRDRRVRAPAARIEALASDPREESRLTAFRALAVRGVAVRARCARTGRSSRDLSRHASALARPDGAVALPRAPARRATSTGAGRGATTTPCGERPARRERRRSRAAWDKRGRRRRLLLLLLVLAPSIAAGTSFLHTLPATVWYPVELAMAIAFGALFGWILVGFWTAVFGFAVLLRGGDRFAITKTEPDEPLAPIDPAVRTAVVMPVYDESVERVFAGLRAVRASLERVGAVDSFDLFILSDSTDPDLWVDEEDAWARWKREAEQVSRSEPQASEGRGGSSTGTGACAASARAGTSPTSAGASGRRYRYMVCLDADSVMSGECLVRLVGMMERNRHVGIIQTAPAVVRARSLFARHPAVRGAAVRADVRRGHALLAARRQPVLGTQRDHPRRAVHALLRSAAALGQAAVRRRHPLPRLRRGGAARPRALVDLARVRSAGNLGGDAGLAARGDAARPPLVSGQPAAPAPAVHRGDRARAPRPVPERDLLVRLAVLWLGFLIVSTFEAVLWSLWGPELLPDRAQPVPDLAGVAAGARRSAVRLGVRVLLCRRLLAFLLALVPAPRCGLRRRVRAAAQRAMRDDRVGAVRADPHDVLLPLRAEEPDRARGDVARRAGRSRRDRLVDRAAPPRPDTMVALAWGWGVRVLHPDAFWWLVPVAGALVLSIPLSVLASRTRNGTRARSWGLFATPEETSPPTEIRDLERELRARSRRARRAAGLRARGRRSGHERVHTWLLRGPRKLAPHLREERDALALRARDLGPDGLTPSRSACCSTTRLHVSLHESVWRLGDPAAAARWGVGR
jgi:membrane glycosyltransferase